MAVALDKNDNKLAVGDLVTLVRYTDGLLKSLPSSGTQQSVVEAVGRRFAIMAIRDGGAGAEVLLRLPAACSLAHSGGHLLWLPPELLAK